MLMEIYKTLKHKKSMNLELVFCSFDHEKDGFDDYTSNMPWLCMPFNCKEIKALAHKYKARSIPHLVVLDGTTGNIITLNGTEGAYQDTEGEKFPWKSKKLGEVLPDQILAPKSSTEQMLDVSSLNDKYLMLYFSAHWCPPCKRFTPILSEAYTKLKSAREADDFELIFISSDRDEEQFHSYYNEMSFCALPFKYRDEKKELCNRFEVNGIPKLIMLGPVTDMMSGDRPLINDDLRGIITKGDFSDFPFHQKNFGALEDCRDFYGVRALIVFHESGDDEEQEDIKKALISVATRYKDGENATCFHWALAPSPLRETLKLPVSSNPTMILLDMTDDSGYYKSDLVDISEDNLVKFMESPGSRLQLEE
jgi:nucleoredoxin